MEKIKIDIISGFLGAGKTSFIKRLLSTDIAQKEKIVFLENEFGDTQLDELVLREKSLTVKSVIAGCICCNSVYSFKESLLEIKEEFCPSQIILEPSGLARLSEIKNVFLEPDLRDSFEIDHEIILVDLPNYWKRKLISDAFFKDQLRAAKVVFFSKCQSIDSNAQELVMEDIQCINPALLIIEEDWEQLSEAQLQSIWKESIRKPRIITFEQKSSHLQPNNFINKKIEPLIKIF